MIERVGYHIFISVLVVSALIIISLFAYSIKSSHVLTEIDAPLIDAAMEVKLELTLAHLNFEEHLAGDKTATLDQVYAHIDNSKWYAEAMLFGGQNSEGTYLALNQEVLRKKVFKVLDGIASIQKKIKQRLSVTNGAMAGSPLDHSFDQTFESIFKSADEVENSLLLYLASERASKKTTDYAILLISILLYAFVIRYTIIHHKKERLLSKNLERMATYDKLTGIPNRRFFDETLSNEWAHALRAKTPISLVLCDIDYFKKYNDALGHQAGDNCLRQVAEIMSSILQRPIDSVSRYGGEEFAYIFPFTDEEGAKNRVDVLQRTLKKQRIPHPESDAADHVTISVGVASIIPNASQSPDDLISKADQALYRAKEKGRNQICMA
ncbi:diguanylate cyclase (GGDEF) domain-containing protein [Mariprofundus aestuarium]|uniref:diguanylate cyclase n=1 Tax=Mariprofundus aestuarium TaxID=1921086 RepID=A0A2K8KZ09_MARES|nr:diguanylate cyclase [Mariprofundus aestuarium]ATX80217.1 diguanylate cyclase (GGDEF) domain-containing protein [Mariprofundus aestuarium]